MDETRAELAVVDTWAFEWIGEKRDERLRNPAVDIPTAIQRIKAHLEDLSGLLADPGEVATAAECHAYAVLIENAYSEYRAILDS